MAEPLAGVLECQSGALGKCRGHGLESVRQHSVEEAGGAGGDSKIRDSADVAVENGRRTRGSAHRCRRRLTGTQSHGRTGSGGYERLVERPNDGERGKIDDLRG